MPEALLAGLRQRQIPIIGGLRAISVFLVVFYHSGMDWVPGGLGVLMFFVISGFLITWLLLKENDRKGFVSLRRFYIRRFLRIFPAFYAYAFLFIGILWFLGKHIDWPQTVTSLLYLANYYQAIFGDPNTGLSHTWSLGIEEQFYLLWPALFLFLRDRPRLLCRITSAIIGCVWIYRFVLKYGFHVWQGYFYEAFDTRMDHLLIGCLLAISLFHFRQAPFWNMLTRVPVLCMSIAGLFCSAALEYRLGDRYRDVWSFIVNPLLCASLIPQLIVHRNTAWVRWLDWKPVVYLGSISYSLYLYQQTVLEPGRKALRFLPFAVQVAGSIAVVIVAASVSYWLIEAPFLRLKDRFFEEKS